MLFFSIVHTMPPLLLIVLVALPFTVAVILQSVAALLLPRYRNQIGINQGAVIALIAFPTVHLALLLTYENWSRSDLRVPMCLLGAAMLVSTIGLVVISIRPSAASRRRAE